MTLTIGMLSWNSHQTLLNTLRSYKDRGLLDLADQRVIYFQDISSSDMNIAVAFGFEYSGSSKNLGIAEGYKRLVAEATGDLFLFLEEDFVLIEFPYGQISSATDMLKQDVVDMVRFRHRENPGNPLWSKQFSGNELSRPEFLLESIYWTDPSKKFVQVKKYGDWFITTAPFANFTNNPYMARTEWLKEYIVPRATGDIERDIQDWWRKQSFKVAQGEGLFRHERLD